MFKSKDKLGPADILVVKAEDYGPVEDEESSDDERWGNREVIGVVCAGKKDEILMDDGSRWFETQVPMGSSNVPSQAVLWHVWNISGLSVQSAD